MARASGRPGFFRSLPLPSRAEGMVIVAVLVVMTVAVGLSAWHASNRTPPAFEPPADAAASASTTEAPDETDRPVLAFYGDSYVSGTEEGGLGPAGWPALVSQRLEAEGRSPHAANGAGYVAASAFTGATFVTLAEQNPEPTADVTIVFGSRNDYLAPPAAITAAAARTYAAIRAAAPQTRLIVIGPAWTDVAVPPELPRVRDAVQAAAFAAGAIFVDPLADRWFFDETGLIGADVINPTDEGHAYLAGLIEPIIRDALAAPAGTSTGATATSTP